MKTLVFFTFLTLAQARISLWPPQNHPVREPVTVSTTAAPPPPPPHIHGRTIYVFWDKDKGYQVKIFNAQLSWSGPESLNWIAKAHYQNMVNKTGWAYVEVETKSSWADDMQAVAAGISEGYLTRDLIYDHWQNTIKNYCTEKPTLCKYLNKYINANIKWIEKNANNKTAYWHQAILVTKQVEGLIMGFKMAANGTGKVIPDIDFVYMNMMGDLMDLEAALNPHKDPISMMRLGHCSALVKIIEDHDIYFSHVTWSPLSSMLRLIKRYDFPYKASAEPGSRLVPATSISFSSYPGVLHSMDDFYVLSSGLAVMETTIVNYNNDLWAHVQPSSLFAGVRTMVANRLAQNGQMWTTLFTRYNSGTYNNQWMILDYNYFTPGRPMADSKIFWVLEQLPGMIVARDETMTLKQKGYFASYNVPFFPEVFETSGTPKMVSKYGDFFSFESNPRAKIFARDQDNVENMETMMKLMRYNDYQHDEFSKCDCTPPYSAVAGISSRADLNPANGSYPFPLLGHRGSAGTDMKVTNLDLFMLQQFVAISGPTFDPLPSFDWETTDFKDRPHFGHPQKFEFPPVIHNWKWL